MQLDVVNSENQKVGAIDVSDDVFGGRVNTDVMWESVVRANAAERRGTHATKNRALVSGSGKKPWRQKGTGRARVGRVRNPLWRHGGTVFGPQPRSYAYKPAEESRDRRAARGARGEDAGRRARGGRGVDRRRDQDQGGGRVAEAPRRHRQGRARRRRASTTSCRGRCAIIPGVSLVASAGCTARR